MRGRRLSLAVPVVFGALVGAGSAHACSCAQLAPHDAMRQADAAIVGRLAKVIPREGGQADYRYRVQRVYKSGREIGAVISVRSSTQSAACGLPRGLDRRYGLFLSWGEGRWRGGLCGVIAPRQLRGVSRQMPSKRPRFHRVGC